MPLVDVKLVGIQNVLTGSDPGRDLEIYGAVAGAIVDRNGRVTRRQNFWFKGNRNHPVSITQDATIAINTRKRFNVLPGERLRFIGEISEVDTFGDDHMDYYADIDVNRYRSEQIYVFDLPLQEADQLLHAIFRMQVRIRVLGRPDPPFDPRL